MDKSIYKEFLLRVILFIKLFCYLFFGFFLQLISLRVEKKRNLFVFGATRGTLYGGNSRYLFDYINKNHPNIRSVWLTKSLSVRSVVRAEGRECYLFYSFWGIMTMMQAGAVFVTNGGLFGDVPYFAMGKTTCLVQLWHGSPIKKVGIDDPLFCTKDNLYSKFREEIGRYLEFVNYCHSPDIFVMPSKEVQEIFHRAYNIPIENLPILGNPRDDTFYQNFNRLDLKTVKRVIFLPTFRGKIGSEFNIVNVDELYQFDDLLRKASVFLTIKLHPYNIFSDSINDSFSEFTNINIMGNEDLYQELYKYDCLVTDYSSVYFDFLHTGRKIVFMPIDIEQYMLNDRQFYYNYDEITPGVKVYSWSELITLITSDEFFDYDDGYSKMRRDLFKRFNKYSDGCNSERVYEYVVSRLDC
nr:CDP-glycerol glycerophosphotransferase family protein [uncultured Desulfuromonas sp.]